MIVGSGGLDADVEIVEQPDYLCHVSGGDLARLAGVALPTEEKVYAIVNQCVAEKL